VICPALRVLLVPELLVLAKHTPILFFLAVFLRPFFSLSALLLVHSNFFFEVCKIQTKRSLFRLASPVYLDRKWILRAFSSTLESFVLLMTDMKKKEKRRKDTCPSKRENE